MSDFQNRIAGVIGRKGSGKSTRAREMIGHAPRVLIWDPMDDHTGTANFDGAPPELDAYFDELIERGADRYVVDVVPDDTDLEFDRVCALAYDFGPLLFVVEEAPLVTKANMMPAIFGKIVRTGRHRGIDLLWTAQRAGEVSRTLTSATDVFVFFSQTEPRDLDAIAERCGADVAERVAALDRHDSFAWDVEKRAVIDGSIVALFRRDVGRPAGPRPPARGIGDLWLGRTPPA